MMERIVFSPVTRISGLLSIDVYLNHSGTVINANCSGEQFRGFETMLKGHRITDAVYFTERICGICSMAQGYTAARLVAGIYGIPLTPEAILLQQAMLGAEFLQNHIRHFYLLVLPDYLTTLNIPGIASRSKETRFSPLQEKLLAEHYFAAMEYSRKCHEMLAIFGGKIPHQHGLVSEGVTVFPTTDRRLQFLALLAEVQEFFRRIMLPDTYLLAETYEDYYQIGTREERFISFGLFDPAFGVHFPAGIYDGENYLPVNPEDICESIAYAWYKMSNNETVPDPQKTLAYSWVKAARYQNLAYEGGPLARKIIATKNRLTPGTLERIVARSEEAALISEWMDTWIRSLPENGNYIISYKEPVQSRFIQINDAPRGPLLHAMEVEDEQISTYQIITPSTWNFSPKDDYGCPGPVEASLIGTLIADTQNPVEIGRIVRAFDPCLSCGTHIYDENGAPLMQVNVQT